jgi:hypothetical protein
MLVAELPEAVNLREADPALTLYVVPRMDIQTAAIRAVTRFR